MKHIFLVAVLFWPACGIIAHILETKRMKTWCGTPVWQEPTTYIMFIPAMIAGPLLFIFLTTEP